MTTQPSIKKILVPIDFSFTSLKALDHAVTLAKITNSEITLLHIIETSLPSADPLFATNPKIQDFESEFMRIGKENLEKVADKLKKKGIANVNTLIASGRAHKEIVNYSKKLKADIIVIGTHGVSGVREFVMGSNTYRVVSDAFCPVISVQRKNKSEAYKNILVPFSDQPHSREKVIFSVKIAEIYGANIHIFGIDDEETKAHHKKITMEAEQIKKIVDKHNLKSTVKVVSAPYQGKLILEQAKKVNADMIVVMGDSEKQNIAEYFLGSVSQQIINHSIIPVLSIHSKINPKLLELWLGF